MTAGEYACEPGTPTAWGGRTVQLKFAALLKGRGAAKKQPGLSTELKEQPMQSVLERITKVTPIKQPEAGTVHWLNQCIDRGTREVFTETVTVTPALANIILGSNPTNRNIRPVKVEQYASDMRGGRWAFNGEPIIIARTGELNDGQHRLNALIAANISRPFLFVFGVGRETRLTLDQGSARTAGDYLGMDGVTNANTVASTCRIVIAYERSGYDSISDAKHVTNAEVLSRANADAGIVASAHFAQHRSKETRAFAPPAIIGFCHYVFTGEHPGDAAAYMEQICSGEGLRKRDPAFAVRDRLLNMGRTSRDPKAEVIFRGWNAYRQDRPLKIVKVLGNLPALV